MVHGHAIITPRATQDAGTALPLNLRPELCWTADDLPHLGRRVREALSFWRQAASFLPPTLTQADYRRFRKTCLQPVLRLTPGLRARLAAQDAALQRLSDQQQALLRGLLVNPRLHVVGPAGSGKTVLALAAAREVALAGKRTLLVCFNRPLGDHLRLMGQRFLEEAGLPDDRLVIRSFHVLCHEACEKHPDQAWSVPTQPDEIRGFWRDEAPQHLLSGIADDVIAPFDAVFVDEAQDFYPDWGEILRLVRRDPGAVVAACVVSRRRDAAAGAGRAAGGRRLIPNLTAQKTDYSNSSHKTPCYTYSHSKPQHSPQPAAQASDRSYCSGSSQSYSQRGPTPCRSDRRPATGRHSRCTRRTPPSCCPGRCRGSPSAGSCRPGRCCSGSRPRTGTSPGE